VLGKQRCEKPKYHCIQDWLDPRTNKHNFVRAFWVPCHILGPPNSCSGHWLPWLILQTGYIKNSKQYFLLLSNNQPAQPGSKLHTISVSQLSEALEFFHGICITGRNLDLGIKDLVSPDSADIWEVPNKSLSPSGLRSTEQSLRPRPFIQWQVYARHTQPWFVKDIVNL
jgi:hypothetical protein